MYTSDSSFSSDPNDSNFELKGRRKSNSIRNSNFQKNYPKNILTSIITALQYKNLTEILLDKGISGKEVQRKNSASINLIHEILTHQLINTFNKHQIELLTSNILLQNSKITKKAFHLLQIREAFSFALDVPQSQFRAQMSRRAKTNSIKSSQNLDFFRHQSSTMFLLTLFCRAMEQFPHLSGEITENKQSTEEQLNIFQKQKSIEDIQAKKTRDILKPSIRLLTVKLNSFSWDKNKFINIFDFMNQKISNTEQKLIQTLNLKYGMAFLKLFTTEVISKCFEKLQKGDKITNSKLDAWVKQYQKKSLQAISKSLVFEPSPNESEFLTQSNQKFPGKFSKRIKKQKNSNKFSPIVLTAPKKNNLKQL